MRDPRQNPITTNREGGHFIVLGVRFQQVTFSGPDGEETCGLDVWQQGARNDSKPRASLAAIL